MQIHIKKLGGLVTDTSTGCGGQLLSYYTGLSGGALYSFRVSGVNKDTQLPFDARWIAEREIKGGTDTKVELPVEVLGTQVRHHATGIRGTAVGLVLHDSGCLHVDIQPRGRLTNGNPIQTFNSDIRHLTGPAIAKMTEKQRAVDRLEKPSPGPTPIGGRLV